MKRKIQIGNSTTDTRDFDTMLDDAEGYATDRTGADIARLIAEARNEAADANWTVRDTRPELLNRLATSLEHSAAREKVLREALLKLANASDDVGVRFFDTDTMEPEVGAMQTSTQEARSALAGEK